MLQKQTLTIKQGLATCLLLIMLTSCAPGPQLTMSWHKDSVIIPSTAKLLILSIGKNRTKRKISEDALVASFQSLGFTANGGLDVFGEVFPAGYDSVTTSAELAAKGFDYVVTIRVLNVNENNQWLTDRYNYTYPSYLYRGFYQYYKVYGLYPGASYMGSDVKVILESNIYQVNSGELIWSGQSMAFRHGPTTRMAEKYAVNIKHDLQLKKLVAKN